MCQMPDLPLVFLHRITVALRLYYVASPLCWFSIIFPLDFVYVTHLLCAYLLHCVIEFSLINWNVHIITLHKVAYTRDNAD